MERFNQNVKMVLVVEGDGLRDLAWKGNFGDKKYSEVSKADVDAFDSFFFDHFTARSEEDEDDRFRVEIGKLDALAKYLEMFKTKKIALYLEVEADAVRIVYSVYNDYKHRYSRKENNNALSVVIKPEKFGVEAQDRIERAITILQGK